MNIAGRYNFYSTRAQVLMLLYAALSARPGGSRQETVDFISREGWWAHAPEDDKPYPLGNQREACWRILIAFARLDAFKVEPESHLFVQHDCWELNRAGAEEYSRVLAYFRHGKGDVAQGYLWTPLFKRFLDPRFEPTSADAKRPPTIYRGMQARIIREQVLAILDAI